MKKKLSSDLDSLIQSHNLAYSEEDIRKVLDHYFRYVKDNVEGLTAVEIEVKHLGHFYTSPNLIRKYIPRNKAIIEKNKHKGDIEYIRRLHQENDRLTELYQQAMDLNTNGRYPQKNNEDQTDI